MASVADDATCARDAIGHVAMNEATVRGDTLPTDVNAAAGLVTRRFIDRQRPSDPWQNGATRRGTSTHSAQGRSSSQTMARCGVTRSAYASRFARAIDPRPSRPCFASQRSIESGFQARFLRLLCAGYRMPWSPGSTRPVSVFSPRSIV